MKRVYVNEKWCLGCKLCEYNCAFAKTGESDMARALKGRKVTPRINVEDDGKICFAVSCRHCFEPLCVKSCLVGALSQGDDGMVQIDREKCIGCATCVLVCPYGCVAIDETGHSAQKCQLCMEKSDGAPRCVAGCPNGAIVFEER